LIEIDGVSKEFSSGERRVIALQDIDLTVAPREFVAVLGPSGCGKSTLLNIVAGFDRPTRGAVRVGGREVAAPSPERGVVFQEPALFPWLSVMDNVIFGPRIQGQPPSTYLPRAAQIIEQVGLRGFEASYPAELSGGMRQRVGIARVLIMQSRVLLMDEPFGALDAITRDKMSIELLRIWEQQQKTVVFVTHSISEAALLSDRVVVLTPRPGRIAAIIDNPLPRPRPLHMRDSAEFVALSRQLRNLLETE
jgi:NitT/TauT family transport system ATP-binding protein